MNAAHNHLLVNHVPVFGVFFGTVALGLSIVTGSRDLRRAAIGLFVMSGIFGWIAGETGDGAEKIVEHLAGVTEELIHAHEEAADGANIAAAIAAVLALGLLAAEIYRAKLVKIAQSALMLVGLVSTGLMARTAFLGGQIRHSEIREGAAQVSGQDRSEDSESSTDKD